ADLRWHAQAEEESALAVTDGPVLAGYPHGRAAGVASNHVAGAASHLRRWQVVLAPDHLRLREERAGAVGILRTHQVAGGRGTDPVDRADGADDEGLEAAKTLPADPAQGFVDGAAELRAVGDAELGLAVHPGDKPGDGIAACRVNGQRQDALRQG